MQDLCYSSGMASLLPTNETTGPEKFGRFYLRELLNSGGMADIWMGSDNRGKIYALRRLKRELRFNLLACDASRAATKFCRKFPGAIISSATLSTAAITC